MVHRSTSAPRRLKRRGDLLSVSGDVPGVVDGDESGECDEGESAFDRRKGILRRGLRYVLKSGGVAEMRLSLPMATSRQRYSVSRAIFAVVEFPCLSISRESSPRQETRSTEGRPQTGGK